MYDTPVRSRRAPASASVSPAAPIARRSFSVVRARCPPALWVCVAVKRRWRSIPKLGFDLPRHGARSHRGPRRHQPYQRGHSSPVSRTMALAYKRSRMPWLFLGTLLGWSHVNLAAPHGVDDSRAGPARGVVRNSSTQDHQDSRVHALLKCLSCVVAPRRGLRSSGADLWAPRPSRPVEVGRWRRLSDKTATTWRQQRWRWPENAASHRGCIHVNAKSYQRKLTAFIHTH